MLKYKNKKILILDCHDSNIKNIISLGDNIVFANNSQIAIELYTHNFFNLVIIDISTNGSLKFIKQIKKISKNKPIMLITDTIDTDLLNLFSIQYIDGIIFKPFLKPVLITLIDRIFDRQEEQDQLFVYLKDIENNHVIEAKKHVVNKKELSYIPLIENYDSDEEIISSTDFFNIFDDTIIDKVEELHSLINDFSAKIFLIEENQNNPYLVMDHFHNLSFIVKEISTTLFYFQYFTIAGKAFNELSELFEGIQLTEHFLSHKHSIVNFVGSLDKDLDSWFYNVFIDRTASNILYFDSSLMNNVYLLSSLIYNLDIGGNDIEFF